jgi:uncharacterized repeat protein (TIGR03943 family)
VLLAWGIAFCFLLLTGRWALFISSRTLWVAVVGSLALPIAGVWRVVSSRSVTPQPVRRRDAWALALVGVPVLVILTLPPVALGPYAASRRSVVGLTTQGAPAGEGPSFIEVAASASDATARGALASRAGDPVSYVGFVDRFPGDPADEFRLTRFVVTCCVVDALAAQVRVVGAPAGLEEGTWVRVGGRLYPIGDEVLLAADEITKIQRPDHPYLTR